MDEGVGYGGWGIDGSADVPTQATSNTRHGNTTRRPSRPASITILLTAVGVDKAKMVARRRLEPPPEYSTQHAPHDPEMDWSNETKASRGKVTRSGRPINSPQKNYNVFSFARSKRDRTLGIAWLRAQIQELLIRAPIRWPFNNDKPRHTGSNPLVAQFGMRSRKIVVAEFDTTTWTYFKGRTTSCIIGRLT
ncbi:MAG: hypothetical protein RL636_1491 [Verrucomicrobiota bacterium]